MQALKLNQDSNIIQYPNTVHEHFVRFIRGRARKSRNTAIKFERDIIRFFKEVRYRDIRELTVEDLKVTNSEVLDYQELMSKRYKNSIVNGLFTGIRSFYKYLKRNDFDVNPDAVVVDRLPDDTISTGFLDHKEVKILSKLALNEKYNPIMKKALIDVAYGTGLRVDALLKLKYKDVRKDESTPNKYLIEPQHLDKGKKIRRVIHADAIEPMLNLKDALKYTDEDIIFKLSRRSLNDMMDRLVKQAGLDPRRGISFHSLRKAGAKSSVKLSNGNVYVVTAQGNWSNADVVRRHYIEEQENIMGMAGFEELDDKVYDKLTHEEAIELLKSLNGDVMEIKLKREAEEIIEKRGE